MKVQALGGYRVASSVVSITTKPKTFLVFDLETTRLGINEAPDTTNTPFNEAVVKIIEHKKIEPFLYQYGRYPRISTDRVLSFALEPKPATKIEVIEEYIEGDLLPQEITVHVLDVHAKNVVLINGGAYLESVIEALPNFSRGFVIFPPYRVEETIPIFEVQNRATRNKGAQVNIGVERVPFGSKVV